EARGQIEPHTLDTLRKPMVLAPGERTTGAQVEVTGRQRDRTRLRIVLHEGRNRQIRRMLEQVGHLVLSLHRIRVGNVELGRLAEGEWRHLTRRETETVRSPQSAVRSQSPGVDFGLRAADYARLRARRRSA